jgi:hypothetical protein
LVRGDALLVLDLGLDIVDGVGRLHLKGDSLTRDCWRGVRARTSSEICKLLLTGLDEDLHCVSAMTVSLPSSTVVRMPKRKDIVRRVA